VSGAQERVAGAGRRLEDVSTLALSFLPSLGKIEDRLPFWCFRKKCAVSELLTAFFLLVADV
jgi:hypothetical protein